MKTKHTFHKQYLREMRWNIEYLIEQSVCFTVNSIFEKNPNVFLFYLQSRLVSLLVIVISWQSSEL